MSIDYRDFKGEKKNDKPVINRWWTADEKDLANSIHEIVNNIATHDKGRHANYQLNAALYGNSEGISSSAFVQRSVSTNPNAVRNHIAFNVISSAIDTLTSKIAKNKPKALFLTGGGNYKVQRKAKKLTKFVEGIMYQEQAYDLGARCFRDACVYGSGIIHVYDKDGQVRYERVMPGELFTDPLDSMHGKPRQLHRVKAVDRYVLLEMFPEKREQILNANPAGKNLGFSEIASDLVLVIESWHLPSGKDATDGKHVWTISNDVLVNEAWEDEFFPFAIIQYNKPLQGLWGQSLAGQLKAIQLELNKIQWLISRSTHMAGSFKIWMKNDSAASKDHINNEIGSIIISETKPEYIVPNAVPPEYYQQQQTLKNQAFEMCGVSQLAASSLKPAGLDSGIALREFNDINTDRFTVTGQNYEQFYLDLARLTIWKARKIYQEDKKLSVKVPGSKWIQTVDWKDVQLEDDEFVLQAFPINSFPSDPAGRLSSITDYIKAGFLTQRAGRRLLDFPDLEMAEELSNAQEDYIHMVLEKIIDDGEYTPPDDADDLQCALELAGDYIAQGKRDGLEEDKLELLRTFKDQVVLLLSKASQPQPSSAGTGAPLANPTPTPQSDLIPNTVGAA